MPTDYYALLGVSAGATDDQIKKAYRKLARELHPDANPGDKESEERFKEVTLAYETLRDPERRHRYDMFGPDGAKAGAGGEPFAGFAAGLGDLFEVFLGGARTGGRGGAGGRAGPLRGPDIEVSLEIDFEEAVFGAEKKVTLRAPFACDACGARGSRGGATPRTCPTCAGTGQVRQVRQSILGQMVTAGPCPACRGMGEEVVDPCPECRGEGRR
ncbi:MAG: DnaJ domain-containing protein, partial [Acidimicrobiales bacterium]